MTTGKKTGCNRWSTLSHYSTGRSQNWRVMLLIYQNNVRCWRVWLSYFSTEHVFAQFWIKDNVFRIVFWDVLPCKIIVDRRRWSLMMEAARTSETSVDNYFTWQYIPEDNPELHTCRRENLKSQTECALFLCVCVLVWVHAHMCQ
jgi:hypothetical protein